MKYFDLTMSDRKVQRFIKFNLKERLLFEEVLVVVLKHWEHCGLTRGTSSYSVSATDRDNEQQNKVEMCQSSPASQPSSPLCVCLLSRLAYLII